MNKGLAYDWSNYEYIWPNAQCNWLNVRAFNQLRSHLATAGRVDQMRSAFGQTLSTVGQFGQIRAHLTKRCAFGQMPCVLSIGQMRSAFAKCADWSNAPYISNCNA